MFPDYLTMREEEKAALCCSPDVSVSSSPITCYVLSLLSFLLFCSFLCPSLPPLPRIARLTPAASWTRPRDSSVHTARSLPYPSSSSPTPPAPLAFPAPPAPPLPPSASWGTPWRPTPPSSSPPLATAPTSTLEPGTPSPSNAAPGTNWMCFLWLVFW